MAVISVRKKTGYGFDSYWMDLDIFCLFRNGEPVPLPPKEFELLQILVEQRGQIVTREELISRLWPDTIVEEANLNVHISALRKVLGESPNSHKNTRIKGAAPGVFCFVAEALAGAFEMAARNFGSGTDRCAGLTILQLFQSGAI